MRSNILPVVAMLIADATLAAWIASGSVYTGCLTGLLFGPLWLATQFTFFEPNKRLRRKPSTQENRS